MISRIILTETLIILDITKTESNVLLYIEQKKIVMTVTDGGEHKTRELDITRTNDAPRSYMT